MIKKYKRLKSKLLNGTKCYIQTVGCKWCFSLHLNELSEFASFISRRKLIQSFSATIRYRFLSFASCHSGEVKIVCCILQVNINILVSIFCEQIRKVARRKTSYCFIVAVSLLIMSVTVSHLRFLIKRVADVS